MSNEKWCRLTDRSIEPIRRPTFAEWHQEGLQLAISKKASPFRIGDWINLGEGYFGEEWTQVIDMFGVFSHNTLGNYASCCKKVPPENRFPELSFNHHQVVSRLPVDEQKEWLELALNDPQEQRPLTAAELRKRIKGESLESEKLTFEQMIVQEAKKMRERNTFILAIADRANYSDIIQMAETIDALLADMLEIISSESEEETDG